MYYFIDSGLKFTGFLSPNAGGIILDHVFPILDKLSRSGVICDQIRNLGKIAPFLYVLGLQFSRDNPQIYGLAL